MSLPESANAVTTDCQLDPQQITLLRGLRKGALLPMLLRTYRDQAAKQIGEINSAVFGNDHAAANVAAHTLKSASFSVGANRIGELCARIEVDARQQALNDSAPLCGELERCFAALLPELEQYLTS